MLRVTMVALSATLAIGALAPQDAAAQSGRERAEAAKRGGVIVDGRRDSRVDERCVERRDSRGNRYWDCDDDRYSRSSRDDNYGRKNRKGGGPKFCQNGQGHPVHGMSWCRAKGWDHRYSLRNVGWGDDVILRRPRYDARGDLGRGVLESILGRRVYSRFDDQRVRLGQRAPLVGYWSDTRSGMVLDLFAGGVQIGQILDRNRDGRADVVRMAYR
jgi:hypothetical protein